MVEKWRPCPKKLEFDRGGGGVDWLARRNGGMVFSVARVESCNARSAKEIQVLGEWIVRKGNQARAAAYGIVFF